MPTKLSDIEQRIQQISSRLSTLELERATLTTELQNLKNTLAVEKSALEHKKQEFIPPYKQATEENIKLFASLFKGREDVLPKRWDNQKTGKSGYSPSCNNEWVRGVCNKPQVKCSECTNQAFVQVNSYIIRKHICGDNSMRDYTIGVYPMLIDETSWFLAIDFDEENWLRDASAFIQTCRKMNVPANLERSRSGNGGHIWIFLVIQYQHLKQEKWELHYLLKLWSAVLR